MYLMKIKDFNPNYKQEIFGGEDVVGFDAYTDVNNEKIGTIHDILVDESGRLRYIVIDTGWWIFGKKVLLPTGYCRIDYANHHLYASGLTKEQVEDLPNYDDQTRVDYEYEERVRSTYRPAATAGTTTASQSRTKDSYHYDQEPSLYHPPTEDRDRIRLYEERLVAAKQRQKTGEVTVGKNVVSETEQVQVPVEKEQVIVERRTPRDAGRAVTNAEGAFQEGEVMRMDVYEENADVRKETVLREEVSVKKEVKQDTVTAEGTVRREELEVDSNGEPVVQNDRQTRRSSRRS
ncbi:MAG: DUF2382 domain-containing protein [Snowella sp.]|nr:DUF2382 domain-containing protein [Snowella sp.]